MSKWIVSFTLLDGRGDAEQHFDNDKDAQEFLNWCVQNPELVSNAKSTANITQ